MIIAIDVEKIFEKFRQLLIIKTLSDLPKETSSNFFNLIKDIQKSLQLLS